VRHDGTQRARLPTRANVMERTSESQSDAPSRRESNSTAALLTLPPHRPHRAELPQWVPQVRLPAPAKPAQLVDWAPLDIHSRVLSLVYVALRRCVYLFAPSLQWVRWPPLSGALPFPTFAGTMSSYDRSLPLPTTSGLPRQQVLLVEGLFASQGRPSRPLEPGSIWVGRNRTQLGRDSELSWVHGEST
jgi:hypothetical protein